MKEEVISLDELMKLDEYSCSLPTLTTIGKRWRCATRYHSPGTTEWKICTYAEKVPYDPDRVAIVKVWAVVRPGEPHRTQR